MLKIYCDKKNCETEISEKEDFGTFTSIRKKIDFDPKSQQQVPQVEKKEFHLCEIHSKQVLDFLESEDIKLDDDNESEKVKLEEK